MGMANSKQPETYSVPEAGRRLGLGRNASYDAARRGELPVLRFDRAIAPSSWRTDLHARPCRSVETAPPAPDDTLLSLDLPPQDRRLISRLFPMPHRRRAADERDGQPRTINARCCGRSWR